MGDCPKLIKMSFAVAAASIGLVGFLVLASVNAAQEDGERGQVSFEYTDAGADDCLSCHGGDDSAHLLTIFEGPHAVQGDARTPFARGQCESCHGPGGEHAGRVRFGQERPPMPAFGPNAIWSDERENQICLDCHQRQRHDWDGGEHQSRGLACTDCHSLHVLEDPVTLPVGQTDVCLDCHVEQRAQIHRPYSHPIRFGQVACSDCHQPHGSLNEAMLTEATVNQNCFQCHAEKRGPHLWEHAPVTEDCTYCHQPHGSNHPGQLTRRAPLLCQQCHSRLGHPSIGRTTDDLRSGMPSAFLLSGSCLNCHSQVHGSNHPSGAILNR